MSPMFLSPDDAENVDMDEVTKEEVVEGDADIDDDADDVDDDIDDDDDEIEDVEDESEKAIDEVE